MDRIEESKLLSKFEKYIGHSSDLFDNEEWREFDAFVAGYELGQAETDLDIF
jgi:hypothetical protein